MSRPREALNCSQCNAPLVTKYAKHIPEGFKRHGGYGKCDPCYKRDLRTQRRDNTPHARPITPEELDNYRAGLAHYFERRRARIQRQARIQLLQKAAS
jgi:hypothetical protein